MEPLIALLIFFPICLAFFLIIIGLVGTAFWVWMLVDCLMYETRDEDKLAWALIIFFTHFVGAIIYYFVKKRQRVMTPPPMGPTQMGPMSQGQRWP